MATLIAKTCQCDTFIRLMLSGMSCINKLCLSVIVLEMSDNYFSRPSECLLARQGTYLLSFCGTFPRGYCFISWAAASNACCQYRGSARKDMRLSCLHSRYGIMRGYSASFSGGSYYSAAYAGSLQFIVTNPLQGIRLRLHFIIHGGCSVPLRRRRLIVLWSLGSGLYWLLIWSGSRWSLPRIVKCAEESGNLA